MSNSSFLSTTASAISADLPTNQVIEVHFIYNNATADVRFYDGRADMLANMSNQCSESIPLSAVEFLTRAGYYHKETR